MRLGRLPSSLLVVILSVNIPFEQETELKTQYLAYTQAQQSTITRRDNPVNKLIYFDDSTSVLHHDTVTRDVFRSADEGKTWQRIETVSDGAANVVIEHPHDKKTAFILTKSKTHYRTINRGETWQSFDTPLTAAPGSSALSFHAKEWRWILFTGQSCQDRIFGSKICTESTFYTQDAFESNVKNLLDHTSRCVWAHSTKEFKSDVAPSQQIFCIAFEAPVGQSNLNQIEHTVEKFTAWQAQSIQDSRLYSSDQFFAKDHRYVDLGIGKEARGVVGIGAMQGFIIVALKPAGNSDEMVLYVSRDGQKWERGIFPHGHGLKENAYTIVDSTSYSVFVDVLTEPEAHSGTLFTSNSDGTYFIRSLEHTNRSPAGIVDFESLQNVDGVAIANILSNWDDVRNVNDPRVIESRITFNDGATWQTIQPPAKDIRGNDLKCDANDRCSLHLHSVTAPHNTGASVFSSTAPGFVMAVGNIGKSLKAYEDGDTFLSTDAGITWRMVAEGAHKYEFGDQGSILVIVDDEEPTNKVKYSTDFGQTWTDFNFDTTIRARALTTIPDSTSLKFILTGTVSKGGESGSGERHAIVFLDFAPLNKRKCGDSDFEKWYARAPDDDADCLMGHKDWFRRRRPDASCFVGEKFTDPEGREENCACTDEDYECDFNYVLDPTSRTCILAGPQQIPAGQCLKAGDTFLGSSGYRKIPGNTCKEVGEGKDARKQKPCTEGVAAPGQVSHQRFTFPALVLDHSYFADSSTIIAHTSDNHIWQSDNEGFGWNQVKPSEEFLGFTIHPYNKRRAYLVSKERRVTWTPDAGKTWKTFEGPTDQNMMGLPLLDFHPTRPEWVIWTGSENCKSESSTDCRVIAHYSTDEGKNWYKIDEYVRVCSWGRDNKFKIDERIIYCESFRDKKGNQRAPQGNPLQLVRGDNFYAQKSVLFDSGGVVGFATFEEYMVAAQMLSSGTLRLMVTIDGQNFAQAKFPPEMKLENMAYTILESSTDSIFLHVTTQPRPDSAWGVLFKSNSNGTNFAASLDLANRNSRGYVDFEKMIGLDGIAVMNVVSNPDEAVVTGNKKLQTRITHNDGGRWNRIQPPPKDSLGNPYRCTSTACGLHLHGYTERVDPRATYSSPSAVGLMIGVGSVGMTLAPYADSDTFLTRDGGFNWEEIHKDAHLWEFGDQGSILVIANDEIPTDHVTYSLDEGLTWQDYKFGDAIKIRSIVTVPMDTSRKFILLGYATNNQQSSVAVHLDFTQVTNVKCKLDPANPNDDDFELWSPSEERNEKCLFGRQVFYHRRRRERNCYIGERLPEPLARDQRNCQCTPDDFECEFNHIRNSNGDCVLQEGAQALESDPTCAWDQDYWYERTAYRKIPHSSCEGGVRLDRGAPHLCPHRSRHGFFWWSTIVLAPFMFTGLFVLWWLRRKPVPRRGRIRLDDADGEHTTPSAMENLSAIPYAVVGVLSAVGAWLSARIPKSRGRSGYRTLALDDDAALLGPEDDD